jgi:hypothetical protein
MQTIIQFFHPGKEHGHDKDNKNHKSWNEAEHRRKFMSVTGDCLSKDGILMTNQDVMFWGEWEPDSNVKEFYEYNNDVLPRYLHSPYIRKTLPTPNSNSKSCNKKNWQNTDPFVFGDNFKYAICQQGKKYEGYRICGLKAGTIIVFGSLYKDKQYNTYKSMRVDTVFVVSQDYIDKNKLLTINFNNLSENDKKYFDVSFRMAFPNNTSFPDINKIYTGVEYKNRDRYNGLFSFIPAMKKTKEMPREGFCRIEIELFHPTNQPQTSFMVKHLSTDKCIKYWTDLKNKCLSSTGCIATRINMPNSE